MNSKEGVHFPLMRQFVAAIKTQEEVFIFHSQLNIRSNNGISYQIKQEHRRNKLEYLEKLKKMKIPITHVESESEEDV